MEPENYQSGGIGIDPPILSEKKWELSKNELLKNWRIEINFNDIGCVISVGCKSVSFYSVEEAMKALNDYVSNPAESQKQWQKLFNR